MKKIKAVLIILAAAVLAFAAAIFFFKAPPTGKLSGVESWFYLSFYDESNHPAPIPWENYDMVILDGDSHPPLEGVSDKSVLIAYVSFGEAEAYRASWPKLKDKPWVLMKNTYWKDSYLVDVRDREWHEHILREVIPQIVSQGFQGLFMDTLSTGSYLEGKDPRQYAGAEQSMIDLVREVHEAYPELLLIGNNAYDILPGIAPYLSGIVAEGINSQLDLKKDGGEPGFTVMPKDERGNKIKILKKMRKKYGLPVFALDYAAQEDIALVKKCKEESRKLGFKSYVAGKKLDHIYSQ